jgi:hypothetical protein
VSKDKPTAQAESPPVGKRRRGPNKPKPGAIEVRTEAVMAQAEIVKLLEAHAIAQLGAAGAAGMELQINAGAGWRLPSDAAPLVIRFATAKGSNT